MKIHKLAIIILSTFFLSSLNAQKTFIEDNSRLIVEMESIATTGWETNNTVVSNKNIQYIYGLNEYLSAPGNRKLTYKIKISNPGTYRFVWHSKVGMGTSSTDHNDTWLRIPDASLFFASKNGLILRPKGVCTSDCPEGAGKDGWFKTYSNGTTNWTWTTSTNDNNPYPIYAKFDNPGTYTVEISMRSDYQFLDRFVLFNESVHTLSQSTNLTLPENNVETLNSVSSQKESKHLFRKDITKKKLMADFHTKWTLLTINGIQISNGYSNSVDISTLISGIYILHTSIGVQKIII